jgi:hypothetical protein
MARFNLTNALPRAAANVPRSIVWLLVGGLLAGVVLGRVVFADDPPVAEKPAAEKPAADKDKPAADKTAADNAAAKKVKLAEQKAVSVVEPAGRQAKAKANRFQGQAANFAQQWRTCLVAELAFVRQICPDLPPPQRVLVKAAGEKALLAAAEQLAGTQDLFNYQGGTPQSMIRDAFAETLRAALPPEQWLHYTAEAEARTKRRQAAVIRLVVEHIDQALYLRPEQRDQIGRAMADHWKPAWEGWLQLRFMQGTPTLPNDIVQTYLDLDQQSAWLDLPKMALSVHYVTGIMPNGVAPDTSWWDEAAPKPKEAGADVPAP